MRMLVARAKGAVCAIVISGLLSGCGLVERVGALGQDNQQSLVPTLSELQSQVDWADPADVVAAHEREAVKRSGRGGDADVPRPKIKPEIVDPKSLVGLDKVAIEQMLGAPHHITLAQPATVWTCEQDGCRMRLFFYPDLAAQKLRALTYEVSADLPKKNATLIETCASRIKWANAETSR